MVEHVDRGLALYDVERHRAHAFTYGGHDPGLWSALQSANYPDQPVERAERALRLAPVVAHEFSTAQTLAFAATLRLLRREPAQALPFLDELMRFCDKHRLALWEANGMILRGWAFAEMEQRPRRIPSDNGPDALRSSGELSRATPSRSVH